MISGLFNSCHILSSAYMIWIMYDELVWKLIEMADKRRDIRQGANLFHQDDQIRSLFVVEQGLVELTRHQIDGTSIVLQRAAKQTVLAEASMYSKSYHCDAAVALPSRICEIPKVSFLERIRKDEAFSNHWSAHLAKEVQAARYRSEILSRKTVAERLDGWLTWQGAELPSKGHWKSVAAQIGVSPEAFYRELAKRRD